MTFEEMLETLRNPGENGIPENFADQLAETYRNDLSIRDAAVTEREERLTAAQAAQAERDSEIQRLKAFNYDLIRTAPKTGEKPDNDNANQDDDGPRGIASLFEKETR